MSNYNSTLQSNNTDLQTILNSINELPNAGGEQATPVISVNSATGLITATAGAKTATHQLAFQPAQTITPTTTNQTIPANTYLGGVQTIKGDANLVASNIVSGKSIFGVVGTATAGGSSGDTSMEDSLITRTFTNYTNDRVTSIGSYAFYHCLNLTSVNFPAVTSIGSNAFRYCSNLTSVSFPVATTISNYAFAYCSKLTSVNFPAVTNIGSYEFYYCANLTSVNFPAVTNIGSYAFYYCTKLVSIYLRVSSVCRLNNSNAFSGTGIWSTTGSIFVPASLVASYKTATNWAYFSKRIFGV